MHKDNNHRHRLKLGHLIQVLSTTLSLGSTALLVLTLTATGSRHHRRCRGHGRRNLRRPRNYLPRQLSRRGRNLYQLPLTRMRFPRHPPPKLSQIGRRRNHRPHQLSRTSCHLRALPLSRMEGLRDLTTPRLSQIGRPGIYRPKQLSRMRRSLLPLPASRIRYPRHQQLNQPRRRLNYRPERLSRLRRRTSRRGLCSREPIFQTDEATTSGRFRNDSQPAECSAGVNR
jgi:hypothetical protein